MPRTVAKILKDDEAKADLGVTAEELAALNDDEEEDGSIVVDKGAAAPTPEQAAEELRKQLKERDEELATERKARQDAETARDKAATTAGTAVKSQIESQRVAIDNRVSAAVTTLESTKQQLKQAKAAGDGDAEVELQDALTNARYELNAATWDQKKFGEWVERQKNAPPPAPATAARKPGTYTEAEQKWINEHPQFKTSKKFARLAKAAAAEAEDNGYPIDSPGYFNFIEDSLREEGLLLADGEDPLSGAGENQPTTSTSVAAAPSRAGNGTVATRGPDKKYPFIPQGFRIPPEWVQAARDQDFDDVREYANMRLEDEQKQRGQQ